MLSVNPDQQQASAWVNSTFLAMSDVHEILH